MAIDVLEYQVLSIIRDRFQYLRHAHILRENLFESNQTRTVYNLISSFHSRHDQPNITIRALRIMLTSSVKPDQLGNFRGIIRRIKRNMVQNPGVVEDLVKRFARRQLLKHAMMTAVESLESGEETDLERVREKVDEAIRVGVKHVDESYDYFREPNRRISEESNEERIATGICSELDAALTGGLAAGEIGIIIAPTGFGKTLTLVNIGYGAMRQGKKVVHATLEISPRKVARRYDTRISGHSFTELKEDAGPLHKALGLLTKKGARLQVKDYTSLLCSVSDIRAYLERIKEKKGCDLLIVDYADLMFAPRQYKEKRHELSSIVAGLRRLASEFKIPVWTASQATREAGKSGRTRLWDVAEDIGKANWADVAITISQDDDQKEEGVAYLKLAKTRMDKGNPTIPVVIDYDTMKMSALRKEEG